MKEGTSYTSTLPVHCIIKDSGRFIPGKKPVPHVGTMVSIEGSLTAVEKNKDTGLPEKFHVDIANVNFMGRPPVPPRTPETPGESTAYLHVLAVCLTLTDCLGSVTPAKRGFKFSFNDVADSPLTGKRAKTTANAKA